ncbi:uncharacterized protein N7484_009453 [Penicillium longicatenatum]|uniref:uncharacterized protein n=1 Tax=Penicillium longicatenatum TaxID=1561947 RepID=UPI00254815D2|nr:uncharacterized protein N7484_009453 [Penicillium longicatenatum]KAJ5636140.1 hypothetical protein N7484_009453 [Penicillium longicatenatum]
MSLNGLDTAVVVEAYQSALADAGGWFLLHYIARDEVALLERGTGGVPEVRNAIDNYEEISPLYGFLQYRRRKVILRYMPEGLSRLILARSNVQFSSVLERFTPNDSVLALTKASDLSESALSSACLLHTASGSITSSSSSLRRRRLMEITEDAEETGAKEETKEQPEPQAPPRSEVRQRSGSQKSEATVVPPVTSSPELEPSPDLHPPPSRASSRPPPSRGTPSETHSESMSPTPQSPASSSGRSKYRNILDEFPRPSEEIRVSTQSARPSLRELERASTYSSTPKVKLGPRPSLDQSGRPRTSGSSKNAEQRPVASLPSNMRTSSVRKQNAVEPPRPRSQGSSFATRPNSRAPPIPPLLVPPPSIPISRPQLSPGAKSLGALSTSSGLTPEKERLMKALQQRRKAMARRAENTKNNSSITEADESKTQSETTPNPEENKENVNLAVVEPEKPEPKPELEPILREEKSSDLPLRVSEPPVSELRHEIPMENEESPILIPFEASKPEPTADIAGSDSEERLSSHTSGPSADTTFSTDHGDFSNALKSETPQTVPEDETRAELGDSAIIGQTETKEELVSSSVDVEAPLDQVSTEVPEVPEQSSKPKDSSIYPSPLPETPVSVTEQLGTPVVETNPEEAPDFVAIPATSPKDTPPNPEVEPTVAPVTVSIDPVPLDEPPLEESKIQRADPIPLDQRRKIHLEPIQVPTLEYSDDDCLLSDDSFMEELRSATVQEARPVAVNSPNGGQSWRSPSRAVSSPNGLPSPSVSQTLAVGGRSTSSSYIDNGPATPLMAKKVNVSSGISSRIKALEKFSSREGTPNPSVNGPAPSASSSFENLRKRASVSYPGDITLPDFSRAPSVNLHDSRPATSMARRTNSISVTAHIVRDSSGPPSSSGGEQFESDVLNLQASPLTVEHESTEDSAPQSLTPPPPAEPANYVEDRSMSMSSAGSSRQTSISRPTSRLSLSSRTKTDENLQSSSPTAEDKRVSRASRLMRRMSSITATSRRSIIGALSSPVKEEDLASIAAGESALSPSPSHQSLSKPIEIGEVNVQFPDTLLWKRRCMRIDENGYVVLTPGTTDATARNMIKRYHLTEFRTPCLPDEDMQELPNSILLNFLDGSTLQCACESRQGQTSALQSLVEAHLANQS